MARRKKKAKPGLLIDSDEQLELMDKSMEQQVIEEGEVECLGMKFANDEERREYFLDILREKLKDPEFRKIEGFPIGEDEDILELSDPPYYTACPNPFIEDFIKHYGKPYDPEDDNYRREPFAADVSEGRSGIFYDAHSYHTKVPHKAIMRYILHYTEPNDIIYDGFSGTGMTGVASQLCGSKASIESLGYTIKLDGTILDEKNKPFSEFGKRIAVLNDISPLGSFIAYNLNTPININIFEREAKYLLDEVTNKYGWVYETLHIDGKTKGIINYTLWSELFVCPECSTEFLYWDIVVDKNKGKILDTFECNNCNVMLNRRDLKRAWTSIYDSALNKTIRVLKRYPVLINYNIGKKRYEKKPDTYDIELIEKIKNYEINYWYPTNYLPEGDKTNEPRRLGITNVHHFYTKRNLIILSALRYYAQKSKYSKQLLFLINSYDSTHSTLMTRIIFKGGGKKPILTGSQSGTLYISALPIEKNILLGLLKQKLQIILDSIRLIKYNPVIETVSTDNSLRYYNSVDYIFTDPPFGGNLMYSELSFILESWLKVYTNNDSEAIQSKTQGKELSDYQEIMTNCFIQYYRVLKPGRWMTVEFHNSKNSVWNAIQESIQHAGFVIADVRSIDKKQGSFNQVTAAGAVKQDLIISTYKPNDGLERRFQLSAGTEDGAWDFIRTHLKQLPIFVSKDGEMEVIVERQNYLLFDRMVAFHVQRGVSVPTSAGDFYKGLAQRFPERDGMYFLPEQVAEYDKKRMSVNKVLQLQLFVNDEASAIQWLKQQLTAKPQTFQDIHPAFMRELGGWQKHEKPLELSDLLAENFLRYDGQGEVPSQIHSYLSSNFKELRNLQKDDPKLKAKAKDRWYVPDPNKAGDLEKLRERSLLKEFEEYKESTQRKLKVFRLEAIRAGFKKAWQEKDYKTIIDIAKKIPDNVLQEDPKLLMWYDQALTRTGE